MNESLKVLCVLVLLVGIPLAAVAWADSGAGETMEIIRWVAPSVSILALVGFLLLHYRRDPAPDLLREKFGDYFNCGGLCFVLGFPAVDPFGNLVLWFQNQYARPCHAKVFLKPTRGFWMTKSKFPEIEVPVACEPGAFGMATVPIHVDFDFSGGPLTFDVSAELEYPDGRGKRLRFHEGMRVRGLGVTPGISVLALFAGILIFSRPARAKIDLPPLAPSGPSDERLPSVTTHWSYVEDSHTV